ncbi:hypothetical protein, partial [Kingella kingae]|uniref:hypothetical protein n=1 Tax=Kingella kingae TaxID=504 RepID=UPI001E35EBB8
AAIASITASEYAFGVEKARQPKTLHIARSSKDRERIQAWVWRRNAMHVPHSQKYKSICN